MSNEVVGYVQFTNGAARDTRALATVEAELGLGAFNIDPAELRPWFPSDLEPDDSCLAFEISDRPASRNASYLIDGMDYAPEADHGLPLLSVDRVSLLAAAIRTLRLGAGARRVVVAVCDSSQIEGRKMVRLGSLEAVLQKDFEEAAPPDLVYVVE